MATGGPVCHLDAPGHNATRIVKEAHPLDDLGVRNGVHRRGTMGQSLASYLGVFAWFWASISAFGFDGPSECKVGEPCIIDVPGMVCADGTQSFISVNLRPDAKDLLIFLNGGGACWDSFSCGAGFAHNLTRPKRTVNWESGKGIYDPHDAKNPLGKEFNVLEVAYCTGDLFAGNRTNNYGTATNPKLVRHRGYQNVLLALKEAKKMFGEPARVVMVGESAGGIGTYFHLRNLVSTFPTSKKFVLTDGAVPFKPPYINQESYTRLIETWNVKDALPQKRPVSERNPADFGELIEYNKTHFPEVRFGLVDSYGDFIMTFFADWLGSPQFGTAVKQSLIHTADHHIGPDAAQAKVFYINHWHHTFLSTPLDSVVSLNVKLSDWLVGMIMGLEGWSNIRPDKAMVVDSNHDWMRGSQPRTIEQLVGFGAGLN